MTALSGGTTKPIDMIFRPNLWTGNGVVFWSRGQGMPSIIGTLGP